MGRATTTRHKLTKVLKEKLFRQVEVSAVQTEELCAGLDVVFDTGVPLENIYRHSHYARLSVYLDTKPTDLAVIKRHQTHRFSGYKATILAVQYYQYHQPWRLNYHYIVSF